MDDNKKSISISIYMPTKLVERIDNHIAITKRSTWIVHVLDNLFKYPEIMEKLEKG